MKLTLEELAIAEAARAELLETPLPPAMGQLGCLAAIAGVVVLVAWPPVVDALPALSFFTPFVMLFAVLGVSRWARLPHVRRPVGSERREGGHRGVIAGVRGRECGS